MIEISFLDQATSRIIIVEVDITQENLDNLAENVIEFNVILSVDSDIDKVSTPAKNSTYQDHSSR